MKRVVNQGKHLFLLAGLGLWLLVLLACTSDSGTTDPTAQPQGSQIAPGTDLSQLLAAISGLGESGTLGQVISRAQSVGTPSSNNTGIWVTGRGEATSAPDLAILNLGVEALADTVSEAREQAATAMAGTVAALQANGIVERDIQTSFFNISQDTPAERLPGVRRPLSHGPAKSQHPPGRLFQHPRLVRRYHRSQSWSFTRVPSN